MLYSRRHLSGFFWFQKPRRQSLTLLTKGEGYRKRVTQFTVGQNSMILRHRIIHFPTSSVSERCKQTDWRVAQYLRLDSRLFWTTLRSLTLSKTRVLNVVVVVGNRVDVVVLTFVSVVFAVVLFVVFFGRCRQPRGCLTRCRPYFGFRCFSSCSFRCFVFVITSIW